MPSGVTPQLFIHLVLQSYFFSPVVLDPHQDPGGLSPLGVSLQPQNRKSQRPSQRPLLHLLSLCFLLRAILSNISVSPTLFFSPCQSQGYFEVSRLPLAPLPPNWSCFPGLSGHTERFAGHTQTPSCPWLGRCVQGGRGLLTHRPPATPA